MSITSGERHEIFLEIEEDHVVTAADVEEIASRIEGEIKTAIVDLDQVTGNFILASGAKGTWYYKPTHH